MSSTKKEQSLLLSTLLVSLGGLPKKELLSILVNMAVDSPVELMKAAGLRVTDDSLIVKLLQNGMRVHAIKIRRKQTGDGLKDAKEYTDGLCVPVIMDCRFSRDNLSEEVDRYMERKYEN